MYKRQIECGVQELKAALISAEVENILTTFRDEFEMVKNETGTIDNISNQTNLLALNASIAVSYTHLDVYKRQI